MSRFGQLYQETRGEGGEEGSENRDTPVSRGERGVWQLQGKFQWRKKNVNQGQNLLHSADREKKFRPEKRIREPSFYAQFTWDEFRNAGGLRRDQTLRNYPPGLKKGGKLAARDETSVMGRPPRTHFRRRGGALPARAWIMKKVYRSHSWSWGTTVGR